MDDIDIANIRLGAQHIAQADFERPEDVVRHLLAMQAQDYNSALWAIGLRTKDCTKTAVEKAIADRKNCPYLANAWYVTLCTRRRRALVGTALAP